MKNSGFTFNDELINSAKQEGYKRAIGHSF